VRNPTRQKLYRRKRRIARRLGRRNLGSSRVPALSARNIHYEVSDRSLGLGCGGIGVIQQMVRQVGLIEAIDDNLHLLKVHLPYHESDHVLNIAYNVLAGGRCLDHLELLRSDEGYLDALGASRIGGSHVTRGGIKKLEAGRPDLTRIEWKGVAGRYLGLDQSVVTCSNTSNPVSVPAASSRYSRAIVAANFGSCLR
jgi:hypothetical protein